MGIKVYHVFLIASGILLLFITFASAVPSGAGITFVKSSGPNQSENATESNITAFAGNLTELIISIGEQGGGGGSSQTWQGYYGNVTGAMTIGDNASNVLFNWSSTAPLGEVFSSVNSSIVWTNVQCFNATAAGSFADDSSNAGGTSQYGLNASQANARYNISDSDEDSINATFDSFDHSEFYVNSLQFSANECPSLKTLNSTGDLDFEEVLLYSPDNQDMIFAAIINQDTLGFDGEYHDFQMLVPEDGHGADTSTTSYYFYIEIG